MEINDQLIQAVTRAVIEQLQKNAQPGTDVNAREQQAEAQASSGASLAGKTRMHPKHSYESAIRAVKGTAPKEIVIGVGAAFQTEIRSTIV